LCTSVDAVVRRPWFKSDEMSCTLITSRRAIGIASMAGVVALLLGVGVSTATASHFRASGPDFVIDGNAATWVVTSAWEHNGAGTFVGLGTTAEVLAITSYADAPGSGAGTGVTLEVVSEVLTDLPLYQQMVETLEGDLSTLSDGLYEIYITECCRVDDIQNSIAEDFSQWVRFSKVGSTYAAAPRLTTPIIYAQLPIDGTTTLISYAATGAATWTSLTNASDPIYGAGALPCSNFVGGVLAIGSEHCTGGDVYTDIYIAGTFWAFKVAIADASGRQSVGETLFRVESVPAPYIDDNEWTGDGTTALFWAFAPDTIVTSWEVECTNVLDSGDVVSGMASSIPITVDGFTPLQEYECIATATSGAGSGSSDEGDYTVIAPELTLELLFEVGDVLSASAVLAEGAELDSFSNYSLVMYPNDLSLLASETDDAGTFSDEVSLPIEACTPGRYELRLSAIADEGDISTSMWVEIGAGCVVTEIRSTAWPVELADTGAPDVAPSLALGGLLAALGVALLIGRRRVQAARA